MADRPSNRHSIFVPIWSSGSIKDWTEEDFRRFREDCAIESALYSSIAFAVERAEAGLLLAPERVRARPEIRCLDRAFRCLRAELDRTSRLTKVPRAPLLGFAYALNGTVSDDFFGLPSLGFYADYGPGGGEECRWCPSERCFWCPRRAGAPFQRPAHRKRS